MHWPKGFRRGSKSPCRTAKNKNGRRAADALRGVHPRKLATRVHYPCRARLASSCPREEGNQSVPRVEPPGRSQERPHAKSTGSTKGGTRKNHTMREESPRVNRKQTHGPGGSQPRVPSPMATRLAHLGAALLVLIGASTPRRPQPGQSLARWAARRLAPIGGANQPHLRNAESECRSGGRMDRQEQGNVENTMNMSDMRARVESTTQGTFRAPGWRNTRNRAGRGSSQDGAAQVKEGPTTARARERPRATGTDGSQCGAQLRASPSWCSQPWEPPGWLMPTRTATRRTPSNCGAPP